MPITLDKGFVKADSANFPKVNCFMVWEFIVSNEHYNAPEIRGVKATLSSRESYGDSAIGYVSVKRENNLCIVKGRICPEHRVRQKAYTVILTVNEENEKIVSVECLDCAASEGGCKHGIAFLMWSNRRSESASPTEVECYWKKPTLSNVGTSQKFIAATEMSSSHQIRTEVFGDNSTFFAKVIEEASAKQLDSQFSRYIIDLINRKVYSLSIHQMIFGFINEEHSAPNFIVYAQERMSIELCKEAEERTRDQNKNVLWHELRFGRITASNIYEASQCKTPNGSLVNKIIGASKVYDTIYMQRGRQLEKLVIAEIQGRLKLKIKECGLFLIPSYPMLGASPDGIGCDFIVEVKCPSSEKTVVNYLKNGKISEKCKAQMSLQMLATGKSKALLCIADHDFEKNNNITTVWLEYDEEYTLNIVKNVVEFWEQQIFTILQKSM